MIHPDVDIAGDVAIINAGRAKRVNGDWVVNGRTYGVESSGRLYPKGGPGVYPVSRQGMKALGAFNDLKNVQDATRWARQNQVPEAAIAEGLRVYQAITK